MSAAAKERYDADVERQSFYIAFLGQIFIISWYFPKQLLRRMKYIMATYPPEQYPKLYPQPKEKYLLWHLVFDYANRIIVALGLVILLSIIFVVDHSTFADDGYISEFWPALYGAIQFLPLMAIEFSEFGQFKLMRQANTSTKRKATLLPRRLFDYVSAKLFVAALAMIGLTIVLDLYMHDFHAEWSNGTIRRALLLVATNLLLVGFGAWLLRGRNLNPHQAFKDRSRQIRVNLSSFLYCSIVLSVYYMFHVADQVYDMDYLDATLLSAYFTVIVMLSLGHILRSQAVDDMDFDVYRENEAAY